MIDSIVQQASHIEARYHDHWMLLNYFIGRGLWIIASVHMPTTCRRGEDG